MVMRILIAVLLLVSCAVPTATVRRSVTSGPAACFDPASYGAIPGDGLADRVAFQAAIDAAAASPDGGTVCIGPGRWTFDRAPVGSYDRFAALSTHGHNLTIRGAGPETVLELAGDQGGSTTILFSIDPSAEHIRVTQLQLLLTATNTDEQTHAIATSGTCSGATCLPIRDVEVDHVTCNWARVGPAWRTGDCVRLLGNTPPTDTTPGTELYGARVTNNTCVTGRACVEVQRGIHDVVISGNSFYCDSCDQLVDGEATGVVGIVGQPTDIAIVGNTFDRGAGAQGDHNVSMTSGARITIANNTLKHGGITLYRTTDTTIMGNAIDGSAMTGDEGVIRAANACDGLTITGNTVKRGGHIGSVIQLVPHSNVSCNGFVVSGNVLTQGTVFFGIYMESASRALVAANTIIFPSSAPAYSAIYMRSVYATVPVTTLGIVGNLISGAVTYAVTLDGSPGSFGAGVAVTNNIAPNTTFGIRLNNSGFTSPVTITGNVAGPSAYGGNAVSSGD